MLWSKVSDLGLDVTGQLRLPSVSVGEKSLLVEKELFMSDHGILIVRTFDYSIDWTSFLAETAVDAFSHVDVIASSSSRTIRTRLTFDCDGIGWASSSTKLASDASRWSFLVPFFACSISPQGMLSSKLWRKGAFFIGIVDSPFRLEGVKEGAEEHGVVILRADPLSML